MEQSFKRIIRICLVFLEIDLNFLERLMLEGKFYEMRENVGF
jgi:hypothetical protein